MYDLIAIILLIVLCTIYYYYEEFLFHLYNLFSYTPGRVVKLDKTSGYAWFNVEIQNHRYDLVVPYQVSSTRKTPLVDKNNAPVVFFPGCDPIISLDVLEISPLKKPRAKRTATPKKKPPIIKPTNKPNNEDQLPVDNDLKFVTIDKKTLEYYNI